MQDYSLDQYLRVLDEIPLPNSKVIYLRSLSDNEMKLRREAAMLASRNRRIELRDESSAAFLQFIIPLNDETDENLIRAILSMSRPDFSADAEERHPFVHLPYPDDAELEERLDIDEQRKERRIQIIEERRKYIENAEKALEEKLQGWSREQLIATCREKVISNQLMAAYVEEHSRQLVFLGSFSDKKRTKRFFKDVEETGEINKDIYRPLFDKLKAINEVDIFALEGFSSTES
jgi:hypothetical protein